MTFNLQDRDVPKNVSRPPRDRDVQDRDHIPGSWEEVGKQNGAEGEVERKDGREGRKEREGLERREEKLRTHIMFSEVDASIIASTTIICPPRQPSTKTSVKSEELKCLRFLLHF